MHQINVKATRTESQLQSEKILSLICHSLYGEIKGIAVSGFGVPGYRLHVYI
jgi:hypothetical protein